MIRHRHRRHWLHGHDPLPGRAASRTDPRVAALCSRDPKKLAGDWTSIQGNFGPRGTQMDLSGVACYRDFEALLADPVGRPGRPVCPQ